MNKKEIKKFISLLPNSKLCGFLGFKKEVMKHLGISQDLLMKWSLPQMWQDEFKREVNRRK